MASKDTPAYEYQLQHINEDQGPKTIAGAGIMMFLCIASVVLRFMAQYLVKRRFEIDDYLALAALFINLGLCIALILCVKYGLGRHVANLELKDPNLYEDLMNVFKCGYTMSVGAIPALFLIKMSLVLYYKRIFTTRNKRVKYALWIVGVYITGVFIPSFVVFVYQCDPIPFFWYRAYALAGKKPPIEGTCLPSIAHQVAPGVFNSFADLLILLLPGLALWPLRMPRAKKLGLFFVFSLGAFVVATSIVKIVFAVVVSNSSDSTYINTGILLWTVVECCIGLVCACIPCMMPLALIYRVGPKAAFKYGTHGQETGGSHSMRHLKSRTTNISGAHRLNSQDDNETMVTATGDDEHVDQFSDGYRPGISTKIGPLDSRSGNPLNVRDNAIHVDSTVRWTSEKA